MTRTHPGPRLAAAVALVLSAGPAFGQQENAAAPTGAAASQAPAESDPLDDAQAVRREGNQLGVASQKRIDAISEETETLFTKYSNTVRQIESIRIYNHQMQELVDSQNTELASLVDQLDRVELVGRSVTPLMLRMIDAIDRFVELDIPFLIDERTKRVTELRKLMARADVNNAEKYRAIMEAYQIENEYGRTIEAYRGTLESGGREITVDFLRFGRIALVYQSLDEAESAVWDREQSTWQPLDSGYRSAIRTGLRIARKQIAPDMIRLPLPVARLAGETS